MKHFASQLAAALAGPPVRPQSDLVRATGMTKSKISRILSSFIACSREDLDALLAAFPDRKTKANLVSAYLLDHASPSALAALRRQKDPWANLDVRSLSPKGQKALHKLLKSKHLAETERILTSLADAVGL